MKIKDSLNQEMPDGDEILPPDYQAHLDGEQNMEQSNEIGELAAALAAAQAEITGARKSAANPFFKSKYADLAEVWDACREPLSKNGLAVIQTTMPDPDNVVLITTLAHKSGQYVRSELSMTPAKRDPQGIGSTITYARRYALAAMVGVAQVDDDGNQGSGKDEGRHGPDYAAHLMAAETLDKLAEVWSLLPKEEHKRLAKVKDKRKAELEA